MVTININKSISFTIIQRTRFTAAILASNEKGYTALIAGGACVENHKEHTGFSMTADKDAIQSNREGSAT